MQENISDSVKEERIYLFLDNASFHKNEEVRKHMKDLNIEPIYNVAYRFEFNPIERLWGQYKQHYRKLLLEKMLAGALPNEQPLKDALHQTFNEKFNEVKLSIPKFIKKSLGMIRREANEIRS